ncbi:MAG: RHS repeat protein [Chitinophagaceae bacterium]|nr:RHS repeat protein [Chitinophagaceae bacterium]
MTRHLLFSFIVGTCLSAVSNTVSAQNNPYKEVSVASPTAASLGKYADIPVSNHTGLPQVGIPIYTVSDGTLSLPVSLSYHAGGLKAMESASWVGAGWSLNAGGVITRTVMGQPDERWTSGSYSDQSKGHLSDNGYSSYLWQDFSGSSGAIFLKDIHSGKADGEPDLFFFNFGGYSGKFYFGDDKVPVILPEQDFRIEYVYTPGLFKSIESFIITVPDGTKYYFGMTASTTDTDPIERSLSISNTSGYGNNGRSISSWYLNKVQSGDGLNSITLNYAAENYSYFNIGSGSIDEGDNSQRGSDLYKIAIEGVRLTSINFTNGLVEFIADNQLRQDLSGTSWSVSDDANTQARALKEIRITDGSGYCRKHTFSYDYFVDNISSQAPIGPLLQSDKKRLKLLNVKEESCDLTVSNPPHTFEYFDELVPRKITFSQDHWGFYNAANNPDKMIPAYTRIDPNNVITEVAGANRDSKWPEMRGGSLKRINYPTGGYSEFDFEANTSWVSYPSYNKVNRLYFSMGYDGNNTPVTQPFTFSGNPYKVTLTNAPLGGYASVTFGCSGTGLFAETGQVVSYIRYFTPGVCNITLSKPDPVSGNGAGVLIEELVPYQVNKNEIVGGLRIKKITSSAGPGMAAVVTDYDYNLSANGHSSGILYSKPTYVQVLKNTGPRYIHQILFANQANWYLDWEDSNPPFWPYFNGGNLNSIKSAAPLLPMSASQGNHIGYSEIKVSKAGNGYSIYRYYGSDIWDQDVRDVCTRVLDKSSPNPPAPEYPAAPLPFEYKRGEIKYEGHWDQANRLLKEVNYYPVYQNLQVTTPGIRVYSIYAGVAPGLITSVRTLFELNSAKKTELTITERNFNPSAGNYLETTTTNLYESPYHAEVTSSSMTNSKNESLVSRTKYAFEFRATGCATTNTCWTDYQTALQNNLNLYISEYGQCTDNDCRALAKSWYQSRNMQARRDYASCRAQFILTYNSCFQTAKAQANPDLKPIYELQDKFINAPIENTEWKANKLSKATFNKYDYVANPTGFVYPSKFQKIDLNSSLSVNFTPAAVNGTGLTKDSRYTDEIFAKYSSGRMSEVIGKNGIATSYLWGYNNTLPIAKAVGVDYVTLLAAYNAVSGNLSQLRTHASLSNAFVYTYTYTPGVGMTSETDPRGRTTYYEYDKLNRLVLVKDNESKIVKKICYNYAGQPEDCLSPCTNTTAEWQNTATALRCQLNAGQNTGYQEQEQKDMNPCSPTYNQLRWIQTIYNTTACPLPAACNSGNCSGNDKKCINGVCETGTWAVVSSYRPNKSSPWTCVWAYCFSDGSYSTYTQNTTSSTMCFISCLQ